MDEPMTPKELADYLDCEVEEEFICYHCKANHHEACVGVPCMCPCEVYGRCASCREGIERVRETLPDGEQKPIPISAAKEIAERYGYHQIVIIGRTVDVGEHVTTYGIDKANCDVAARIGDFLKFKVMGWVKEEKV